MGNCVKTEDYVKTAKSIPPTIKNTVILRRPVMPIIIDPLWITWIYAIIAPVISYVLIPLKKVCLPLKGPSPKSAASIPLSKLLGQLCQ